MKKQDFLKILSDRTGIEVTKITEIINSESDDVDVEIKNIQIFTDDELTERLKNHVNISKPTLIEMEVKSARNEYGLEFEGKTITNLVNAAIEKGKKEADIEPNEKISELESINQKLKSNILEIEEKHSSELEVKNKELNSIRNDSYINSLIPDNLDTSLSKNDIAVLFKSDNTAIHENGKITFTDINGEPYRVAKTQDIKDNNTVLNEWLEAKGIKEKDLEGRGGDNNRGKKNTGLSSIKNSDDFYKYCDDNNIPQEERFKLIPQIEKENSEFVLK